MASGGQAYRIRRRRAHHYLAVPVNPPAHYSIRLTATNASGSDTKTITSYITVTR